jgi:ribosomal protein S4
LEISQPVPEWLVREGGEAQILRPPERNEIDDHIEEQLVVDYYSR